VTDEEEEYELWIKPWWEARCVHPGHYYYIPRETGIEQGCFRVLREAERVVVLDFRCMHQVHVCVNIDGAGGSCKAMTYDQYKAIEDMDRYLLLLVQDMAKELRSIAGM
jgi:hypothetical protein